MSGIRCVRSGLVVVVCLIGAISPAWATGQPLARKTEIKAADAADVSVAREAIASLKEAVPQAVIVETGGRVTQIAGHALAGGESPMASVESFRKTRSTVFGVPAEELEASPLAPGGDEMQPVMFDPAIGDYKFMMIRYAQKRAGIPVFRSELRLLVRNEPGYPLVLANSSLNPLGAFTPNQAALGVAFRPAQHVPARFTQFSAADPVIWAGVDNVAETPRLAYSFIAETGSPLNSGYEKRLFVIEPGTGKALYEENLIIDAVTGNVSGNATTTNKSDNCAPEAVAAMPYATVSITGGATGYCDAAGNYNLSSGAGSVTVQSPMSGQYFFVDNVAGAEETLSATVTPPGPADFTHNAANTTDAIRAQINGYIESNIVRDFALTYNPAYPTIATQTNFPVKVNRIDGYCPGNAWYDGASLNFCSAASGYPNTAYSSVVHHEYGHHLVQVAGSGQGQYGEGMGDCMAMLIADDPVLGYGFLGSCSSGLRSADNSLQYPCGGEIHYCGQLLSGAVWNTRNQLAISNPGTYLQIISNLTVNSILIHTCTLIDNAILTAILTLDDNDGNLGNSTPHWSEICAGFGAHGFTCPALATGLSVSPTSGLTAEGDSGGPFSPSSMDYTLENLGTYPINYSVANTQPWISLSSTNGTLPIGGSTTVTVSINAAADALANGDYSDTVTFQNTTDHLGDTTRSVSLRVGVPTLQYEWNMDTDPGWTTEGLWAWGQPTGGGGQYGGPDPTSGYTGLNVYGYNLNGDYPNNMPEQHLTSTPINCSGMTNVTLSFWRWLGVEQPQWDHVYIRVSNDGTNWTTIGQNYSEYADFAWEYEEVDISTYAANQPTFYLRWTMGTTDTSWQYCGWNIDDVQIRAVVNPPTCSDGVQNQGEDRIDCGGPCTPCACTSDGACDDSNPCNGVETCNANGQCQPGTFTDCNSNGQADSCDIAGGAPDCNTNGIPDSCDLAGGAPDCDSNGIPDSCDRAGGAPDCNTNGILDSCDIDGGASDCNTNGIPDPCEGGNPCGLYPEVLMTFVSSTTVPSVGSVANEDIVAYNETAGTWSLYFDGSDVGLSSFAIDALARLPSGDLLISLSADGNVAGLTGGPSGTAVDNSDIIKFTPGTLGANTTGAWSFYFDGSDVALTTDSSENIDGLEVLPDGKLLISTTGDPSVSGLSGTRDEDVMQFTPGTLGAATTGAWAYYFDGSDVGLGDSNNEDVDALCRTDLNRLLLSTIGNFSVPGVSGPNEDILQFTPTTLGTNTAGAYASYLDLSTKGISGNADLNAVEIVEGP